MDDLLQSFIDYKEHKTPKEQKKYHLEAIARLLKKLITLEDDSLRVPFSELLVILKKDEREKAVDKQYQKIWTSIKVQVKEKHGLVEKGEVVGQYLALGVSFGLLLGVAFMSLSSGYLAIGLPIGIGVGLAIGASKEKALEEDGKIF